MLKLVSILGVAAGVICLAMTLSLYSAGESFGIAALLTLFNFFAGYRLLRLSARKV